MLGIIDINVWFCHSSRQMSLEIQRKSGCNKMLIARMLLLHGTLELSKTVFCQQDVTGKETIRVNGISCLVCRPWRLRKYSFRGDIYAEGGLVGDGEIVKLMVDLTLSSNLNRLLLSQKNACQMQLKIYSFFFPNLFEN